jgi:inner membrane protein
LTHSLLMVPLLALAAAGIWWWARRAVDRRRQQVPPDAPANGPPVRFGWLYACAFLAVAVHPLLDYATSFGTQLFAPISSHRYAADAIGIMDIFFTSVLAATLLACFLLRRFWPAGRAATLAAWVGFLLALAYVATGRLLHDRAIEKALASVDDGHKVLRAEAFPAIGSIFLWRAVVETERRWHVFRVHFLAPVGQEVRRSTSVWKQPEDRWTALAGTSPQVGRFRWFTGGLMRTEVQHHGDHHVVICHDMRYGLPMEGTDSLFTLEVELTDAGSVKKARESHDAPDGRRRRMLSETWNDLWNP